MSNLLSELWLCVFQFLEVQELLNVSRVNKTWYGLSRLESIWKELFKRNFIFTESLLPNFAQTWIECYKKCSTTISNEKTCTFRLEKLMTLSTVLFNEHLCKKFPFDRRSESSLCKQKGNFLLFINVERHATPILYLYDPSSENWYWTPDLSNLMPVSTGVVSGGIWSGQKPVLQNRVTINALHSQSIKPIIIIPTISNSEKCTIWFSEYPRFTMQNMFLAQSDGISVNIFTNEDEPFLQFKTITETIKQDRKGVHTLGIFGEINDKLDDRFFDVD